MCHGVLLLCYHVIYSTSSFITEQKELVRSHTPVTFLPSPGWYPLSPCQLGASQRPGECSCYITTQFDTEISLYLVAQQYEHLAIMARKHNNDIMSLLAMSCRLYVLHDLSNENSSFII